MKLGDICIGSGSYGIAASSVAVSPDLPTYLRITDIKDDGTLDFDGLKSVDDPNADKYYLKGEFVFYTTSHNSRTQMSADTIALFMKKYGAAAHKNCADMPEKLHPHMLRHTRAMHLYRQGMPMQLLSEYLGHANYETTKIYAYADTEMKRLAVPVLIGTDAAALDEADIEIAFNAAARCDPANVIVEAVT